MFCCMDRWNARWFEAESISQMKTICLIELQLISVVICEYVPLLILKVLFGVHQPVYLPYRYALHGSGMSHATTDSPKPSFRAPWRVGNTVVDRGNAGWTTSNSEHICPCQNPSQGPSAEKTGRGSLLNRLSCPPATQSVTGLNWTELNYALACGPNVAATLRNFRTEYNLWCFDWMKLLGWLANPNPLLLIIVCLWDASKPFPSFSCGRQERRTLYSMNCPPFIGWWMSLMIVLKPTPKSISLLAEMMNMHNFSCLKKRLRLSIDYFTHVFLLPILHNRYDFEFLRLYLLQHHMKTTRIQKYKMIRIYRTKRFRITRMTNCPKLSDEWNWMSSLIGCCQVLLKYT